MGEIKKTLRVDLKYAGVNFTANYTPRFGGVFVWRCWLLE